MNTHEMFVRTPISVLHDVELSDGAFRLYLEIFSLAQVGQKGYCWATNKALAETFQKSVPTITRAIVELEKRGYLRREEVRNANTKQVVERRLYPLSKTNRPPLKNDETSPTKMINPSNQKRLPPPLKNDEENKNNTLEHTVEHNMCVSYPDTFETLWKSYPHKVNKRGAFKAYKARLNEGVDEEELIKAAANYSSSCKAQKKEECYIMHGSTFFGPDRRYEDYLKHEVPQPENENKPISRLVFEGDDLPF